LKPPIEVKDIWEFAPHRPPMVWVDQILEYGANHGESLVHIKADAHYMNENGLRPSSCLEFIAQSYGFISICHRKFTGDPVHQAPRRAFLASFKDAMFCPETLLKSVRAGDILNVRISGVRQMGPIILFQGQVHRGNELLCESQMKVFSE
jgi:predicted hotdog family 3-hydroxylacyl-ACP dehydratase